MKKILTIFLVMMFVMVGVVSAFTLNVATTGVDSGNCQLSDCLTIGYAIGQAISGDTINVADGTYTITAAININKGVTITGNVANPEKVIVQYSPASSTLNCIEVNSADVTIQGIKVQDCKDGFYFDRSVNTNTGVTISNCIIESVSRWGIGEISSPNTVISHNTITNAGDKGIYFRYCEGTSESNRCEAISNVISGCGQSAIQTFGSKYAYIYNNIISSTNDKGINIIRSGATGTADRVQVIGNTISEIKWPGIQVIGAPYTYVYDNTLTKCNYYGSDGTGDWDYASIHVQDDSGPTYSHHTIIDNNTVSDSINGIQTWSDYTTITNNNIYDMGATYGNEKVVGSRTYKNSGILVGSNWGSGDIDPIGVIIENNNIYNNYWGLFYSTDLTNGVTAEYNYWGTNDGNIIATMVSENVDYTPWLPKSNVGGQGADFVALTVPDSITYGTLHGIPGFESAEQTIILTNVGPLDVQVKPVWESGDEIFKYIKFSNDTWATTEKLSGGVGTENDFTMIINAILISNDPWVFSNPVNVLTKIILTDDLRPLKGPQTGTIYFQAVEI